MANPQMRKGSKWWYGTWVVNGKTITVNLNVLVEGRRPTSPDDMCDQRFRLSREKAQAKLDEKIKESRGAKQEAALAKAVYKARIGKEPPSLKLDDLSSAWVNLPRRRQIGASYVAICRSHLDRFVAHVKQRNPQATTLADVTTAMAESFMAGERARGVVGRTYNGVLSLLKSTFTKLRRKAGLLENPFDEIVSRDEDTIHRIPFTPEELKEILDAAKDDDFCRPLIVTGICTAMRRGDVCQLRWEDVDMKRGFITLETSKTGAGVTIPMFELLRLELAKLPRTSEYCFPEQAETYQSRPDVITNRLGKVFAAAGFADGDDEDDDQDGKPGTSKAPARPEPLTDAELATRGRDSITACAQSDAIREMMLRVFDLYMDGKSTAEIAAETGISKGSVSHYFKRIEEAVGTPVVRRRRSKRTGRASGAVHASRPGLKRVNQRGFHAFRATWVTLALTAGVPMELVRKVTGHTTADTVMTHYFQPGQDAFREALMKAMPTLLTGGDAKPPRDAQMKTILDGMNAKNWKTRRDELLALLQTT